MIVCFHVLACMFVCVCACECMTLLHQACQMAGDLQRTELTASTLCVIVLE